MNAVILYIALFMQVPEQNLLIFSNASWCKPCIKMKQEVFTDDEVKTELKSFTINDNLGDKDYKNWKVDKIPTFIIIENVSGIGYVEKRRFTGFMDKKKFLEFLKR